MKLIKEQNRTIRFFYTGFRIALVTASVVTTAVLLAGFFWLELETARFILLAAGTGLLTGIISYLASYRILINRLELLQKISQNISQKKFESYKTSHKRHRDEVDVLTTQMTRASQTVEREIKRLNKIENYRKEFIGDISHELKTPIFAIQGFIETLLDGALEDQEVNRLFLNKAMRNVNRLSYLTKDLMEISRLETGELKSTLQSLNLRTLILDVTESLQYKAQKERVEIKLGEIDPSLHVRADRSQLKQVLINLIENGMKYNRAGGYVEINVQDYRSNRDRVLISVQDTGIGIEPEDIRRVTERFFRVDKSRSREKGGTGLGLSIVKHIIEVHGEELFIDSEVNKGSVFSFTLTRSHPLTV
jgi:two-component system, OmpR family, phosphate regulon sensor histidine kinase PhoR